VDSSAFRWLWRAVTVLARGDRSPRASNQPDTALTTCGRSPPTYPSTPAARMAAISASL
jgi:hypothetical protein